MAIAQCYFLKNIDDNNNLWLTFSQLFTEEQIYLEVQQSPERTEIRETEDSLLPLVKSTCVWRAPWRLIFTS